MDPTPFRAYARIRWIAFLVGAVIVCTLAALVSIFFLVLFILLLLLGAGLLYWTLRRTQAQLDRHDGSIPMRGLLGYLGADISTDILTRPLRPRCRDREFCSHSVNRNRIPSFEED